MDLIERELSIIVLHANMIILHVDISYTWSEQKYDAID